jgi:hypothetical protein
MYIGEIILFTRVLGSNERQQVEGYLATKWGTTGTLPASHPFKTGPPGMRLYQPNDTTTPEFWFDAGDQSTITASGTTLTTWSNKGATSGSNITVHASNALTGTTSQNNANLISLSNGTVLKFTGAFPTQVRSRFIATRPNLNTTTSNLQFLYQNLAASSGNDYVAFDTSRLVETAQGVAVRMATSNIANQSNVFAAYTFVNASTTGSNRIAITGTDQPLVAGSNVVASSYNTASATNYINNVGVQDIGEWISYNTQLSGPEIQQVEGYLAWKWGIQGNLPIGHSFKGFPPSYPVFNPSQVSTLALWLDAADSTTITTSGSSVTQWNDKVSNIAFTTTGTTSNATLVNQINSKQTIYLNNSASDSVYMAGTFSNILNGSAFYVLQAVAQRDVAYRPFLTWGTGGGTFPAYGYLGGTTTTTVGPYTAFGGTGSPTQVLTAGSNYMIFYGWTGTTTSVTTNGSSVSTGSQPAYSSTTTTCWVGADGPGAASRTTWYAGEILLFTSVLGTAERQKMEGYLAWKWGLEGSLPVTHPFKKFQP